MTDRTIEHRRWTWNPGATTFAAVTVVAFGGAFLAYDLTPWGPYIAAALMFVWASLALYSGHRQEALDRAALGIGPSLPRKLRPSQYALRLLIMALPLGLFLYALLLSHEGKPAATVQAFKDGAFALFVAGQGLIWAIDWIYSRRARARPPTPSEP